MRRCFATAGWCPWWAITALAVEYRHKRAPRCPLVITYTALVLAVWPLRNGMAHQLGHLLSGLATSPLRSTPMGAH
eukprot:5695233-Prorocentrum_lima.AAC.1